MLSIFSCMASLDKYLLRYSAYFSIGLFVYLLFSCMSCLYILEIKPLLAASFATIFSHPVGCLLRLFSGVLSFAVQKLVSFSFSFFSAEGWCCTCSIGKLPVGWGSNQRYSCQPTPQPQQSLIRASSVTYTTTHGYTRPLIHWGRPYIFYLNT